MKRRYARFSGALPSGPGIISMERMLQLAGLDTDSEQTDSEAELGKEREVIGSRVEKVRR